MTKREKDQFDCFLLGMLSGVCMTIGVGLLVIALRSHI